MTEKPRTIRELIFRRLSSRSSSYYQHNGGRNGNRFQKARKEASFISASDNTAPLMSVTSTEKINEEVDKGCRGVIVFVYDVDVFEVELFDSNNNTIDVLMVSANQIQEVIMKK
jgi:CRISPR/Cas system-associated protein Cas5 (RAMP superfamily)